MRDKRKRGLGLQIMNDVQENLPSVPQHFGDIINGFNGLFSIIKQQENTHNSYYPRKL